MNIPQMWPLGFWVSSNFLIRHWGFCEGTSFSMGPVKEWERYGVGGSRFLGSCWLCHRRWDTGTHHTNVPKIPGILSKFHAFSATSYFLTFYPLSHAWGTSPFRCLMDSQAQTSFTVPSKPASPPPFISWQIVPPPNYSLKLGTLQVHQHTA